MNWYLQVLKKYAVFSGRARRSEYWYFVLFNILISIGLTIIDLVIGTYSQQSGWGLFSGLYALAVLIPGLAVSVRRLHDTGKSGLWFLIVLIPLVGPIVLLVFMCSDSDPGENQYGLNPKEEYNFLSGL
jgi:uncharacterized membrane protein YhaH (DUF805 family)